MIQDLAPFAPVVAVEDSGGFQLRRVAAGAAGFGHRENTAAMPGDHWAKELVDLVGAGDAAKEIHVAFVGCGTIHRDGAERRPARSLEHRRLRRMIEPHAAEFNGCLRRQQAFGAGQRDQFVAQGVGRAVLRQARVLFKADDLVDYKGADAVRKVDSGGRDGEIGHRRPLVNWASAWARIARASVSNPA